MRTPQTISLLFLVIMIFLAIPTSAIDNPQFTLTIRCINFSSQPVAGAWLYLFRQTRALDLSVTSEYVTSAATDMYGYASFYYLTAASYRAQAYFSGYAVGERTVNVTQSMIFDMKLDLFNLRFKVLNYQNNTVESARIVLDGGILSGVTDNNGLCEMRNVANYPGIEPIRSLNVYNREKLVHNRTVRLEKDISMTIWLFYVRDLSVRVTKGTRIRVLYENGFQVPDEISFDLPKYTEIEVRNLNYQIYILDITFSNGTSKKASVDLFNPTKDYTELLDVTRTNTLPPEPRNPLFGFLYPWSSILQGIIVGVVSAGLFSLITIAARFLYRKIPRLHRKMEQPAHIEKIGSEGKIRTTLRPRSRHKTILTLSILVAVSLQALTVYLFGNSDRTYTITATIWSIFFTWIVGFQNLFKRR